MKINALEIVGFGHWREKHIDLDQPMVLLYGGNEAGKTTIYHFILAMLFGFPTKRKGQRDYTPKDGGPYGGHLLLTHPQYGKARLTRFKGVNRHQAQLQLLEQPPGYEISLETFLGSLTAEVFQEVFTLEQGQLLNIHQVSEERLEELLLTIGLSGSQELFVKQTEWQLAQQKLYKVRGVKPAINETLVSYRALQEKIVKKQGEEGTYRQLLRNLEQIAEDYRVGQTRLTALREEGAKLKEQLAHYHLLEEYRVVAHRLAHDTPRLLDEQSWQKLQEERHHLNQLKRQETFYLEEKQRLLSQHATSPSLAFYLENEQGMEALGKRQLLLEGLVSRQTFLKEQLTDVTANMNRYQQELGLTEPVQELKSLPLEMEEKLMDIATVEQSLGQQLAEEEHKHGLAVTRYQDFMDQRARKLKLSRWLLIIPLVLVVASVGAFVFQQREWALRLLIDSVLVLGGIGAGGYIYSRYTQNQGTQLKPTASSMLLAELKEQQAEVHLVKQNIGEDYDFPMAQSARQWLFQLPKRAHLQELVSKAIKLQSDLHLVEAELNQYQEALAKWRQWVPGSGNLSQQMAKLVAFNLEMSQASQQLVDSDHRGAWQVPLQEVQAEQAERLSQLEMAYPEVGSEGLEVAVANQETAQKLKVRMDELSQKLTDIFDLNRADSYQKSTLRPLLEQNEGNLTRLRNDLERLEEERREGEFTRDKLAQDGTLPVLYQEEARLKDELLDLASQWTSLGIASAVVDDLLAQLAEQRLPGLLKTTSLFFNQLTLGAYQRVEMIEGQLRISNTQGVCYYLNDLSTGTRDQLYLALRLAFIELYQGSTLSPLIIDDGWLHYDSQRKVALFEILHEISQSTQVICLTSDPALVAFSKDHQIKIEHL